MPAPKNPGKAPGTRPAPARQSPGTKRTASSRQKQEAGKKPWGIIFWTAFVIVIFSLFFINADTIRQTLEPFINRQISGVIIPPALSPESEGSSPEKEPPAAPEAVSPEPVQKPAEEVPAPQVQASSAPAMRERVLYFTRIDPDGDIIRVGVVRQLPVSGSPLLDVLNALAAGPNREEQNRNLRSLIPRGVKILSAAVRDKTAFISFSEEFQFNPYGVEGYAGALREIIWTATEFSTVEDVQFLIEGRHLDYLGEGSIQIRRPLNREF